MAADHFTQIANGLFRDQRLSFKAKGIFGLISTHRDGFGVTPESIARLGKEGLAAVRTGLQELERFGYLVREQPRRTDGTMGPTEYYITDTPISEPDIDFPHADGPHAADQHHKNTNHKNTKSEEDQKDVAPSARRAADARRATDRSSAREAESGSAASGATAPKTPRSKKTSSERLTRQQAAAVRTVEAALPSVLVGLLPKYRPPVLRDAVLEALESRTPGQLAARVERRWHAHGYADAHHSVDGKGIGSPVGVAVALVRPSVDCPDLMCEDGTTIDTGQPCRVCEERRAGRKGRRGQSPAETPVGSPVAAWWECSDCRAPVRGEKPSEDAVCRDCQAAGEALRAVLAGPMPDDQECHPQARQAA
jgi:hypothetical protein